MIVRIVETTIAGTQKRVLASFDNFESAYNHGVKINNNRMPLHADKFTFFWDYSDRMVYTEVDNFFAFAIGRIVQSDNNHSPIRFSDAKIIDCFARNYHPYYMVRFKDNSTRIVRESDIRIQALG